MLTPQEKADRARDRMLETTRQYSTTKYMSKYVAPCFQRMVRAEAGAEPGDITQAVIDGEVKRVPRRFGDVVCVTCGKFGPWSSGLGGMHTGHFLASRRFSILLEEDNVAVQCARCNRYESGEPQKFRLWMEAVRGQETIDRLTRLKNTTRQFTMDELVDKLIEFKARLKAAERKMLG